MAKVLSQSNVFISSGKEISSEGDSQQQSDNLLAAQGKFQVRYNRIIETYLVK